MDCPKGCGALVQRQRMFLHLENDCVHRTFSCPYCHITGEYQFIVTQHRDKCPNLPVPCPNKCFTSRMPRENIKEHLKTCPLERISCVNECGMILLRKDLNRHAESNCPRQVVRCQYCQREGEHHVINGRHREYCLKLPIKCPNDCEIGTITREDAELHRKNCPMEKVYCEYYRVGCDTILARKDMAQHNKEKVEDHLSLALRQLDKLEWVQATQTAAIDKALQKFNNRISTMEIAHQREVNDMKTELQSVLGTHYNNWVIKISKEAIKVSQGAQVMPVIIKMSGFRIKKDEGPWTSDPFYSHTGGHKLKLTMNLAKSSDWFSNRFSHFSLSLSVIYGMQDRRLKRGTIKISLLNQCSDTEHRTSLMNVWVPSLERDVQIGKVDRFISYEGFYKSTTACQYLQNSNIFIKLQWIQLDQISSV